jgi:hypothetical protein
MWDYYFEMQIIEFFNYYSFRLDKTNYDNAKLKSNAASKRK